jgi:hypothetical protein
MQQGTTLATKDGFQNGQTAKARQGHRVQSLLSEDEIASYLCLHKRLRDTS